MLFNLPLILIALAPVALTALFSAAQTKTRFGGLKQGTRFFITGLAFGLLACLATEFGVQTGGASLNVRDASVLCAGLIFGGPAGITAGLIGGIERFLSPFVPDYTRTACAIATICAGFLCAFLGKFLFNGKRPAAIYGLWTATVVEVLHLLILVIDHTGDINRVFELVRILTFPMVVLTAASVALAITADMLLKGEKFIIRRNEKSISEIFQRTLLYCILLFLFCSLLFTFFLGKKLSMAGARNSAENSIYILFFIQTIVFFLIFVVVFILTKNQIVQNIYRVTGSLEKIAAGNLGERVNVAESREFKSLSDSINTTVASLKENLNRVAAQSEKELLFARTIQMSAMPSVFPAYPEQKEFDIYARALPAKEIGGDFYDFYFAGEGRFAFLVADVSGKGVPSAMFMMRSKTLLKSLIESGLSPAEVFEKANNSLCRENDAGMFLSVWLGICDLKKGSLTYASAGHKMPLLIKEWEEEKFLSGERNSILGGLENFSYKEQEILLEDNDEIFLWTDGITGGRNKDGEAFGQERLLKKLHEIKKLSCREKCETSISAAEEFRGAVLQDDDIAVLCFKFNYRLMTGQVEYNDVVEQAVEFALKAHRDVKRKSSGVPYILHPIEVSAISSRLTTEREVMAAALLHDTVEDAGVTEEQLEKKFGHRVTELVMAETEDKMRQMSAADSWKMRKEESIRDLRSTGDAGVKAMWLSDKLSNLRSLYADWREKKSGVWQVFNQKDPAQHAWLYMSIIECLGEFKETPEYREYIRICREVFGELWTFSGE